MRAGFAVEHLQKTCPASNSPPSASSDSTSSRSSLWSIWAGSRPTMAVGGGRMVPFILFQGTVTEVLQDVGTVPQAWWGVPFTIPLATASSSTHHPLEDLWDADPKAVPVPADPECYPCPWWPCTGHSCRATVTHPLPPNSQEQTPCCYIFFSGEKQFCISEATFIICRTLPYILLLLQNIPKCLLT